MSDALQIKACTSGSEPVVHPDPPERLPDSEVRQQSDQVHGDELLMAVLDGFPGPAAIVNDRRQIVAANHHLLDACGVTTDQAAIGERLGDALGCVEAAGATQGCGSAAACAYCGAGRHFTVMEEQAVDQVQAECLITRRIDQRMESLEFSAALSRLPGDWVLVTLQDISGEKRRRVLERCFFHDVLNHAGGLQGLASLLEEESNDQSGLLSSASQALIDELQHHRMLLEAESGTYALRDDAIDLKAMAEEVAAVVVNDPATGRHRIELVGDGHCRSDRVLLRRVLLNLVKNACEAVAATDPVRVEVGFDQDGILLQVTNPGEMSHETQAKIFKRSFSTKASAGRGVGTWSVRLLTERYLGGAVAFRCEAGQTMFTVRVPGALTPPA